jgi:hypothetical protein
MAAERRNRPRSRDLEAIGRALAACERSPRPIDQAADGAQTDMEEVIETEEAL